MNAPGPVSRLFVTTYLIGAGWLAPATSAQTTSADSKPPAAAPEAPSQPPSGVPQQQQQQPLTPLDRFPPKGWPDPVHDRRNTFAVAEVIDFRPNGDQSDFAWDLNGWHGGDLNRLWFKSEGEQSAREAERNIDAQLLYGRFVKKFYDVQLGAGVQTATFKGRSSTRAQAVVGFEAFVPFKADLETLLFISQDGDVSGRVTFIRDLLITQRLILQPRVETNIAAQQVERFRVGTGLNNIELGVRVRYEVRREFGPYVGLEFDRSFFGTADLLREDGEDPSQWRFVFGVRVWR